ncbi:MAG: GAF domain-containing protein, partial [Betaproteobacteria bacterium]|nr:GAF domain-containing protein [Betaproteobacteria bacterium]
MTSHADAQAISREFAALPEGAIRDRLFTSLEYLNQIGIALSQEKDINRLLETILIAAKKITNADGGTLYRLIDGKLKFEIVLNNSLGIAMGGTTGVPVPFYPIPLHQADGAENNNMVAAYSALHGETVNIADAYTAEGFDFSGTRAFDKKTGYRSTSFLTIPMQNHESEIIGVLQLLNAQDDKGVVVPFTVEDQRLAESLSSQAAIALTNRMLINQLEELFESLIDLINTAIDDKSPYTGGHCKRVPSLTMMIADAACATTTGPLASFGMTEKDRYELKIAGLLHDCGKITTPVHVVDKATKLETIYDRIHFVSQRFEILKRDAELDLLRATLAARDMGDDDSTRRAQSDYTAKVRQLDEDREFLQRMNVGGERMSAEDQARVNRIAAYPMRNEKGELTTFLSKDERDNLNIPYGTLTAAEREIINHHIEATIKMLEALPWPMHLKNVPEYAGGHHERMDGKGYPRG